MKKSKLMKSIFILTLIAIMMSNTLLVSADIVTLGEDIVMEGEYSKDLISYQVIENGLFEEEKVQQFYSFIDVANSIQESAEGNSVTAKSLRNSENTGGYPESCVIVRTDQDIAFDTSKVISASRCDDLYFIQYETLQDALNEVEMLKLYPTVKYAVCNNMELFSVGSTITESDAKSSQDARGYIHYTYGADKMSMSVFADYVSRTTTGNVTVAVLDTGININHPLFQGRLSDDGYDFFNDDDTLEDYNGHGSRVAGVIADCTQGLNVEILPVKIMEADFLSDQFTGFDTDLCATILGIRHAIDSDVDVINASFGVTHSDQDPRTDVICSEIDNALSNGIIVVAAAGNNNKLISQSQSFGCPGHKSGVLVTAACDTSIIRWERSNYGATVDFCVPGVSVKSCSNVDNNFKEATGTSIAAPHISAAAAMLRLIDPDATYDDIEEELISCSIDIVDSDDNETIGKDKYTGWGIPSLNKLIETLPFYDVESIAWYHDSILEMYKGGYMTGRSRNHFIPTDNMKRQDVAVLFYRMSDNPFVEYRTIYSDVASDSYYANASVWAYDSGVMTGWLNGQLGVDTDITRQDFALTLYRYANYLELNVSETADINGYTDAAYVSEYAHTAVSWAVAKGFMGSGVTTLNPLTSITRAEVAVMTHRFMQEYNLQ